MLAPQHVERRFVLLVGTSFIRTRLTSFVILLILCWLSFLLFTALMFRTTLVSQVYVFYLSNELCSSEGLYLQKFRPLKLVVNNNSCNNNSNNNNNMIIL